MHEQEFSFHAEEAPGQRVQNTEACKVVDEDVYDDVSAQVVDVDGNDYEVMETIGSPTSTFSDYDDIINHHSHTTDLVICNPQLQRESLNYEIPTRRNRNIYDSFLELSDDLQPMATPYNETGGTYSVCQVG